MATTQVAISPEALKASQHTERTPDPCIVVIFGASGDLTKRKLLPALFHLEQSGLLPKNFAVVGVARRDMSQTFASDMREGIVEGGGVEANDSKLDEFVKKVSYFSMDFDSDDGYGKLQEMLAGIDKSAGTKGNRLFYLAVAPEYFEDIIDRLGKQGMNKEPEDKSGYVHVVIEKPFGHDLESARELSNNINKVFNEDQIFRIDHYL